MNRTKLKAFYALMMLMCFCCGLLFFVVAADEQSVLSNGQPEPNKISLQELIAHGPGPNRHIELTDFYFGTHYVYTTKLVQFKEVYVPIFAKGQAEDASNLHLLFWIRNDRNSNLPLIEDQKQLDELVEGLNRNPGSILGVLHSPPSTVRKLTEEAYPGTDTKSLQALWARDFPAPQAANLMWGLMILCFGGGFGFFMAYRRQSKPK
jgi:hypothetical protein